MLETVASAPSTTRPHTPAPAALARLGCASLKQFADRQLQHLRALGDVTDLVGLLDWQSRVARNLWQDQQRAADQALCILGLRDPAAGTAPATLDAAAEPTRRRRARSRPAAPQATFELFEDSTGDHRFRLKSADGTVLLISNPYKSRASAVNGIDVVRRNAANDDRYVTAQDTAGPSFDLRAGNSRVISSSTAFASTAKMEAVMAMVKRVAASARIETD